MSNCLFVIDGDVYRTTEEKRHQIEQVLTGDTQRHQTLREEALTKVTQFILEEGYSPERYISSLIKNLEGYDDNEIKQAALDIVSADDEHNYIDVILDRLGEDRASGLRRILELASKSQQWDNYINPVEEWIISKAPQVREPLIHNNNSGVEITSS